MCWYDRYKTKKEKKKDKEFLKKYRMDDCDKYKEICHPVKLTKSESKKLGLFWIYTFNDVGSNTYHKKEKKKMLKKIRYYEDCFWSKFS
jgi:hypothetical protein